MKTTVTPIDDNKVRLDVEVDLDELGPSLDAAARELSKGVNLKGFRKGNIPRKVLERYVPRAEIAGEAVRIAVPQFLAEAIISEEVDMIGRPSVDAIDGGVDGPLTFSATVDVRPEIEIGDLSTLEVTTELALEVDDAAIDEQVEVMRDRFATTEVVDRPAIEGDQVLINVDASNADGPVEAFSFADTTYLVGSGSFVETIDTELVGAQAGAILEFTDTIPDGAPQYGGESLTFKVLLKEVRGKVLPDVTDEWVDESTEFDTVTEMRTELAKSLADQRLAQVRAEGQEKTFDALVERTGLKIPDSVIDEEVEERLHSFGHDLQRRGINLEQYLQMTGDSLDEMRDRARPDAKRAVEVSLLLRQIANEAELEVTDAEVDEQVELIAAQVQKSPAKVRKDLDRGGQLRSMAANMLRTKALRHLFDTVEVTTADGAKVSYADDESDATDAADGAEDTADDATTE